MNKLKIAIILVAVGVIGLLILNVVYSPGYSLSGFRSNGERIFFTATSNSGKITSSIGTMTMRGGMMGCAVCHGADGKGRRGSMMMWDYEAPDIRYSSLTTEGHGGQAGHEGEPPFTDELIKRAITQGLDPEGKQLKPPMPVYQMSDSDLNDLMAYLKTLK